MGSVTQPSRAQDSVDMARIVFGAETLEREHVIMGLANANSPMSWDYNMLGSAKVYAENNQIVLVTPFILGGAMAPVTIAAAATQTLAEALAGHGVLPDRAARRAGHLRLVRVVDVDAVRARRRSGRPSRSSSCSSWPRSPAGSASRSAAAATSRPRRCPTTRPRTRARSASWPRCRRASTSTSTRPAGWRAAWRSATRSSCSTSTRRRWPARTSAGVDLSENGLALQAMLDSGPGQHFLGSPHTLANFENAFWRSQLSDNNSFEQWELDGGARRGRPGQRAVEARSWPSTSRRRSTTRVHEELLAWIARRKASFPDSDV